VASCVAALGVAVHQVVAPTPVRWDASLKNKLVTEACSVQLAAVHRPGMPVNDLQARRQVKMVGVWAGGREHNEGFMHIRLSPAVAAASCTYLQRRMTVAARLRR